MFVSLTAAESTSMLGLTRRSLLEACERDWQLMADAPSFPQAKIHGLADEPPAPAWRCLPALD
jgi:hypothetical protein